MTILDEALATILAVWPDYSQRWAAYADSGEREEGHPYTDVGLLANWVVDDMKAGRNTGPAIVFAAIETVLSTSNPAVRKLVIVGLLEDIQNISLNVGVLLANYRDWIGPQTSVGWNAVMDLWSGKITADEFNSRAT